MILKHVIVAASIGILLLPPSYAGGATLQDVFNVKTLHQACIAPKESQTFGRCFGYVQGVADAMMGKTFCLGDRVDYSALIQAYNNWAAAHPEKWTEFQIIGVMTALSEKWPCKD